MAKSRDPLHFPHPGEILQTEFLEPMGITQHRLAMDLKIPHILERNKPDPNESDQDGIWD